MRIVCLSVNSVCRHKEHKSCGLKRYMYHVSYTSYFCKVADTFISNCALKVYDAKKCIVQFWAIAKDSFSTLVN